MTDGYSTLAEKVDWLLEQSKSLLGIPASGESPDGDRPVGVWVSGPNEGERRISWPVSINDVAPADFSLTVDAYPNDRPQTWSINLLYGRRIMGLDFVDSEKIHNNANGLRAGDNLPLTVQGPHIHYWHHNRRFCTRVDLPDHLHLAATMPQKFISFDTTFRWFCDQANIAIPGGVVLELPPRERFL